jgi:hypothetical protein
MTEKPFELNAAQTEALGNILANGGKGLLDLVGKIVEGVFRMLEGIAINADPLSQGVAIVGFLALYNYLVTTEPYASAMKTLKLDGLYGVLTGVWSAAVKSESDAAAKILAPLGTKTTAQVVDEVQRIDAYAVKWYGSHVEYIAHVFGLLYYVRLVNHGIGWDGWVWVSIDKVNSDTDPNTPLPQGST